MFGGSIITMKRDWGFGGREICIQILVLPLMSYKMTEKTPLTGLRWELNDIIYVKYLSHNNITKPGNNQIPVLSLQIYNTRTYSFDYIPTYPPTHKDA